MKFNRGGVEDRHVATGGPGGAVAPPKFYFAPPNVISPRSGFDMNKSKTKFAGCILLRLIFMCKLIGRDMSLLGL